MNDASSWSLEPDDVLEAYREAGHPVEEISAIASLELRVVETVVEGLASRYRMAALGEGAATGAAGLAGALASVPAVASTAMRAIHEYGYYYGFDLEAPENREHALLVLAAVASSGEAKAEALDRVSAYADQLHRA
ncbi:MAG: EcsC family protein, partial [Bradymonadaceae bacterium]